MSRKKLTLIFISNLSVLLIISWLIFLCHWQENGKTSYKIVLEACVCLWMFELGVIGLGILSRPVVGIWPRFEKNFRSGGVLFFATKLLCHYLIVPYGSGLQSFHDTILFRTTARDALVYMERIVDRQVSKGVGLLAFNIGLIGFDGSVLTYIHSYGANESFQNQYSYAFNFLILFDFAVSSVLMLEFFWVRWDPLYQKGNVSKVLSAQEEFTRTVLLTRDRSIILNYAILISFFSVFSLFILLVPPFKHQLFNGVSPNAPLPPVPVIYFESPAPSQTPIPAKSNLGLDCLTYAQTKVPGNSPKEASVGEFESGQYRLTDDMKSNIVKWATPLNGKIDNGAGLFGFIVLGSADLHPIQGPLAKRVGDNYGMASLRALSVAEFLRQLPGFADISIVTSVGSVILDGAPLDQAPRRTVKVCALLDLSDVVPEASK